MGSETFGPPWTVLKLLEWSKGFFADRGHASPRLDAELLLAHVLGIDRVQLYVQFDRPLDGAELDAYRALVKRRAQHEPVAYLIGTRGFWTLDLATDARALVPRPDTEVLVEEALKRVPAEAPCSVLDLGTGTGAVALAIRSERPNATVTATDIDPQTLQLAAENAAQLGLEVELVESDLFRALGGRAFDVIVSNPPYVADGAELGAGVREFEPAKALFAGADGLDVLRVLVPQAREHLAPGGALLVEIGWDQAAAVQALFADAGFTEVAVRKDYGDHDRVVSGVA